MGIQDLGAIGEFVSSLVIVVTLMVLIYETRGAKQATLQANAQERQRRRDDFFRSLAESPDLAGIVVTADAHQGLSRVETATEFGLEPDHYVRLNNHYLRVATQMRDAYLSGLPEDEKASLDVQIGVFLRQPAFTKWYDTYFANAPRGGSFGGFWEHVEEIRATL